MKRFNKKFAPLFIAGSAVFVLGTAFKYIFLKDHSAEDKDSDQTKNKASHPQSNRGVTRDATTEPTDQPK